MTRKVVVELTVLEARNMLSALGNTVDHPDAMASLFPDAVDSQAAARAKEKLRAALYPPKPAGDGTVQVFEGDGTERQATASEDAWVGEVVAKGGVRLRVTSFDHVSGSGRIERGAGPTTTRLVYGNGTKLAKVDDHLRKLILLLGKSLRFYFEYTDGGMGISGKLTHVERPDPRAIVFTVDQ